MDDKLMSKIEKELNDAVCTIGEFEELGISVDVKLKECIKINAGVGRIAEKDRAYRIEVNTGVISSLQMSLVDKYMVDLDEDAFEFYQFGESGTLFRYFDDSTLKNSFMNVMAKFIEYNILFHECGHILLGHCDKGNRITERNNGNKGCIGYGHQAREFMADWYGIKKATMVTLFGFAKSSSFSIMNENDLHLFRKVSVMILLALYCQFDLFEEIARNSVDNGIYKDEFSDSELKKRSHPHPYVRLIYGIDAMKEAMMDVIEMMNGVDSEISEEIVTRLIELSLVDVFDFFEKMKLKSVQASLSKASLIESYIRIRKVAASPKHSAKSYIDFKMEKMPIEYLDSIRRSKR